MLHINSLIWDDWNVGHIAKHKVKTLEVEEVCQGKVNVEKGYDGRVRLVGPTQKGRMLSIILAPKESGVYYPVTARPASRKERQNYLSIKGGGK